MAAKVDVQNRLDAPHLDADDKLHLVLGAYFQRRDASPLNAANVSRTPWNASHFGLGQTRAFQSTAAGVQSDMLTRCAQGLLEEAYAIEKTGLCYCAKLVLLSETTEERMAYSLIAADEATHLHWVTPLVDAPDEAARGPFVRLLSDAVERGERLPLILLMQVVLEGWGLSHYRRLAEGCTDGALEGVFRRILLDEALHHGSGKHLFRANDLTEAETAFAIEFLASMLQMVRVGPQGIVRAVARSVGGLTSTQCVELFEELDCLESSRERLSLLRGLLTSNGATKIAEALDARGLFEPLPATTCAQVFASSH